MGKLRLRQKGQKVRAPAAQSQRSAWSQGRGSAHAWGPRSAWGPDGPGLWLEVGPEAPAPQPPPLGPEAPPSAAGPPTPAPGPQGEPSVGPQRQAAGCALCSWDVSASCPVPGLQPLRPPARQGCSQGMGVLAISHRTMSLRQRWPSQGLRHGHPGGRPQTTFTRDLGGVCGGLLGAERGSPHP